MRDIWKLLACSLSVAQMSQPRAKLQSTGGLRYIAASESGLVKVACMLLERGADITVQNEDGSTPLVHLAPQEGELGVATILIELERCAVVTARDKYG
jgi:ankyrin repeat protein